MKVPAEKPKLDRSAPKVGPAMLNITFHASMVTAYERDAGKAQELLKAELERNHVKFEEIKPFTKTYGDSIFGQSTDVGGYVIRTENEIIIVYRGTDTNYDTYRDVKFMAKSKAFGGKPENTQLVHGGFLLDYESSKASRDAVLAEMSAEGLPVVFTGHSLGGAVAQIAAADYAAQDDTCKDKLTAVHTFGTPRAFVEGSSVEFYNDLAFNKTLHVMAAGDPVIGIPPACLGFAHTGSNVMMQTISSSGGENHKIGSYQMAVSNFSTENIEVGDTIRSRRLSIAEEIKVTKNASKADTPDIWAKISACFQVMSLANQQKFWTEMIRACLPSVLFDQKEKVELTLDDYLEMTAEKSQEALTNESWDDLEDTSSNTEASNTEVIITAIDSSYPSELYKQSIQQITSENQVTPENEDKDQLEKNSVLKGP